MGRVKRPSFLKRQKEQKRAARATEKREQRRLRKQARAEGDGLDSDIMYLNPETGMPFEDDEMVQEENVPGGAEETRD